jgi:GNAT superfamily N-acetyltransferase
MDYRIATKQDIPVMCRVRKLQLIDEGIAPDKNIDEELSRFFDEKLSDGSLVEWLLEENGKVIATAAILFIEFPPTFTNAAGVKGYITNMYTSPDHRGKGIATAMLYKLMNEARNRSVHNILLHASIHGKPVYERFGFVGTGDWMELTL